VPVCEIDRPLRLGEIGHFSHERAWVNSQRRAPQNTEDSEGIGDFSVFCGALRWLTFEKRNKDKHGIYQRLH
jgi:hypothetical protein